MLALAPHHTKQGGCQDVGAVVPKRQPSRLCAAAHGLALVTYLRTPVAHCMTLSAAKAPLQQRPASPGHVCTDGRSCISRRVLHSCVAAGALAAGHTPSCCERPDAVFSGCALAPRRRTCSRCWTMRPGGSWRPSAAGLPRAHPNGPTPRPPRPRLPTLPARRPAARPARPAGTARAAPPRSCPAGPLAARPARLAAAAGSRWRQPPPRRQRGRRLERLSLAARLRAADPRSLRCRVRPNPRCVHLPRPPPAVYALHPFLSGPPTRSSRFLNPPPPSGGVRAGCSAQGSAKSSASQTPELLPRRGRLLRPRRRPARPRRLPAYDDRHWRAARDRAGRRCAHGCAARPPVCMPAACMPALCLHACSQPQTGRAPVADAIACWLWHACVQP